MSRLGHGHESLSKRGLGGLLPFECLADVRQVHLNAMLILVCLHRHFRELAGLLELLRSCSKSAMSRRPRNGTPTFDIDGQYTDRRFVLSASRQGATVKIDMVRRAQDENALAEHAGDISERAYPW